MRRAKEMQQSEDDSFCIKNPENTKEKAAQQKK